MVNVLLLTVLLIAPAILDAQDVEPLRIGTSGLRDVDGSVFYSVFLESNPDEALGELTISSTLPEGATFVDVFWTPEAATFVGEENGVVTWTLPELATETIIGPFTYQVTFEDEEAVIPAHVAASVTFADAAISALVAEGELVAYEDTGSLTVDAAGTEGLIPVENTGVYLLVPEGAFDQAVTFTFTRQPFTEETDLPPTPEDVEGIWWCTLFDVTVEPAGVEASLPIIVLFPTRRALTPGMEVINFVSHPEIDWDVLESEEPSFVSISGNYVITPMTELVSSLRFTAGVSIESRTLSTSRRRGATWTDPEPVPWVDPDIDPWVDPDPQP